MNNNLIFSRRFLTLTGLIVTGCGVFSSVAMAQGWSLGGGAAIERAAYRDYKNEKAVMPLLNYEGKWVYLRGPAAGVYLLNTDAHIIDINIYYSPLRFKPADSRNQALKQLTKRKNTAMAGIHYAYQADWGKVYSEVAADILGRSDGVIIDAGYSYSFHYRQLVIEPTAGVQWQNKKYHDYYYGIGSGEAQRSGLERYSPDSGFAPYVALSASYTFFTDWEGFVMGGYRWLSKEAKDSPMVNKNASSMAAMGVIYHF